MSFGIIQYNFGQETLQPILLQMIEEAPDVMVEIFGEDYITLTNILSGSKESMINWADSISTPNKTSLISPWKEYFVALGKNELCQSIQQENLKKYWQRAINPICKNYGLKTCRGYAMAFDIAVNLWALGDDAYNEIMSQVTEETSERDLLYIMAQYGKSSTKYRREAIASGQWIIKHDDDTETTISLDTIFGLNDNPFR